MISAVIEAAFEHYPISRHIEQFIVKALRAAKALTISLVAEVDGKIAGHIAFSPVLISDGSSDWYRLGPLAVLPAYQRQGIFHQAFNATCWVPVEQYGGGWLN